MQLSDSIVTQQTMNWVKQFIIELDICPFAKREVEKESVRLCVVRSKKIEVALEELMTELQWLDSHKETETTLLIFPTLFRDFHHYLDFVDLAEAMLADQQYEGVYQLATFHPDYCFAETESTDVSNYTNRSPYPMLHLLREASLDKAIDAYGDTAAIPDKNIQKMQVMGRASVENLLQSCLKCPETPPS